jgi:regulator of sirC expression with transglutaminase-like and TPR domain
MLAVQDRLVVLLPQAWPEFRDRGLAHAELGHAGLAVADMEVYLTNVEEALDLDAITARVAELRRERSG